jgi:hypothetical protein
MSNRFPQFGRARQAPPAARESSSLQSLPDDEDESFDNYTRIFLENGVKLQEELMVNSEAIAAAQRESLAEFQRKRQPRH